MKKIFLSIFLSVLSSVLFAHALWIETSAVGQTGKKQAVKVFYGEYVEFAPEPVAKWYSDVRDFSLWLITPDGQKTMLPTVPMADHFAGTFVPEKSGQYHLYISHNAKDLGRTTLYQFNASAVVQVGQTAEPAIGGNDNPLKFSVAGSSLKKPVIVQGIFNNRSVSDVKLNVFAPKGWSKEIHADGTGKMTFVPEWKGIYMLELSRMGEENGTHHGKAYTSVWRCATQLIEVN